MTTDCWIQTFTGARLNPFRPEPGLIRIYDIAKALSHQCRFAGHSKHFYSVAQHSVLVSLHVPPVFAMEGLLHDAAEAYLPDMPRPMKPFISNYYEIEQRLHACIAGVFGLPEQIGAEVKRVDNAILRDEASQLMDNIDGWVFYEPALAIEIVPMDPVMACDWFLERFLEIKRRGG